MNYCSEQASFVSNGENVIAENADRLCGMNRQSYILSNGIIRFILQLAVIDI